MTTDQKKLNLLKHVDFLCKKLNDNGIFEQIPKHDGSFVEEKWAVYIQQPEVTFLGAICSNKTAFMFLKQNGYLDKGVCWDCGEEPILNKNTFSDNIDSTIQYYICDDCYRKGRSRQNALGLEKNTNTKPVENNAESFGIFIMIIIIIVFAIIGAIIGGFVGLIFCAVLGFGVGRFIGGLMSIFIK